MSKLEFKKDFEIFIELITNEEEAIRIQSPDARNESGEAFAIMLIEIIKKHLPDIEDEQLHLSNYLDKYFSELQKPEKRIKLRYNLSDTITATENYIKKNHFEENSNYRKLINCTESILKELRTAILFYDDQKYVYYSSTFAAKNNELTKMNNELQNTIASSIEKIEIYEKEAKNILPSALSMMGIFSAILIVFFSGISLINIISLISSLEPYEATFFALLIGLLIFNILFIFVFFISRMTDRSINVKCSKFVDKNWKIVNELKQKSIKSDIENEEFISLRNTLRKINDDLDIKHKTYRVCSDCIYSNIGYSLKEGLFEGIYTIEDEKTTSKNNSSPNDINDHSIKINTIELYHRQCGQLDKAINKYPYAYYINIIFFILEFLVLIWWFVDKVILKQFRLIILDPLLLFASIFLGITCYLVMTLNIFYQFGKENMTTQKIGIYILVFLGVFMILGLITSKFIYLESLMPLIKGCF